MFELEFLMFNSSHFHDGFYLEEGRKWDILRKIKYSKHQQYIGSDTMDEVYDSADVFLHGSCNLFSLALHEEFGYTAYVIKTSRQRCFHCFCKTIYENREVYIDVRGITSDYSELLSEFDLTKNETYEIILQDIDEDRKLLNEGDATGYDFAKEIIRNYHAYYEL